MRPIPIELDKLRHVRYTWKSIIDIEHKARQPLRVIINRGAIEDTLHLLWGGLKTEDPTLTVDQVGDLIQQHLDAGKSWADIEKPIVAGLEGGGWAKSDNPEVKAGG